jgi:hypothetical protein
LAASEPLTGFLTYARSGVNASAHKCRGSTASSENKSKTEESGEIERALFVEPDVPDEEDTEKNKHGG